LAPKAQFKFQFLSWDSDQQQILDFASNPLRPGNELPVALLNWQEN
jgi:hypothetical protein